MTLETLFLFDSSTRTLNIRYRQRECGFKAYMPVWDHNDDAIPRQYKYTRQKAKMLAYAG